MQSVFANGKSRIATFIVSLLKSFYNDYTWIVCNGVLTKSLFGLPQGPLKLNGSSTFNTVEWALQLPLKGYRLLVGGQQSLCTFQKTASPPLLPHQQGQFKGNGFILFHVMQYDRLIGRSATGICSVLMVDPQEFYVLLIFQLYFVRIVMSPTIINTFICSYVYWKQNFKIDIFSQSLLCLVANGLVQGCNRLILKQILYQFIFYMYFITIRLILVL